MRKPTDEVSFLNSKQLLMMLSLATLWSGSFLFIRMAVPFFGPVPLSAARAVVATLTLMPLLLLSGKLAVLREHWRHIMIIGLISTALPVVCLSISTQYTSAGFASVLNALTPIFSALVAWLWLKEYLSVAMIIGILMGFAGVIVMVFDRDTISSDFLLLPVLAGLLGTLLYGLTGNYSRRFTRDVPALVIAGGCQLFAALFLLPAAALMWPATPIPPQAWLQVLALGMFCTGLAFILYFHLLANIGVARTVVVTYLVPMFAMLWGKLFLDEDVTLKMLIGAICIMTGIGLTTYRHKRPI